MAKNQVHKKGKEAGEFQKRSSPLVMVQYDVSSKDILLGGFLQLDEASGGDVAALLFDLQRVLNQDVQLGSYRYLPNCQGGSPRGDSISEWGLKVEPKEPNCCAECSMSGLEKVSMKATYTVIVRVKLFERDMPSGNMKHVRFFLRVIDGGWALQELHLQFFVNVLSAGLSDLDDGP
ncbi:hypothetical protein BDN67DRAFT_985477 [Paxillus ammoniavirescens]|nr:hypothetical protein BDN67DRAFT_985477 [Paxillus ammoniavirescens]